MELQYFVSNFYNFFSIPEDTLSGVNQTLCNWASEGEITGLIILAPEGMNGTLAGDERSVESFKEKLRQTFPVGEWTFKDSWCEKKPFPRFKVKERIEIVTTGVDEPPSIDTAGKTFLTPSEWHKVLEEEDVVVLDTRNWYETELGMFRNAIDPRFTRFQQFPEYVEKCNIPKDKKVLMYCTGGIRCEKASTVMREAGYEHVFQLEGGILKYLEEYPEGHFSGECFVFDRRVAVDNKLEPTKRYSLCPHYGQPTDINITCECCGKPGRVMERCLTEPYKRTCSKDCAYRLEQREKRAKRQQERAA